MILCKGDTLTAKDLDFLRPSTTANPEENHPLPDTAEDFHPLENFILKLKEDLARTFSGSSNSLSWGERMKTFKKALIQTVLLKTKGNKMQAAEILRIPRSLIYGVFKNSEKQ
jgi:transcriptional regulator with PAS, ATPase and Fis domain